MIEILIFLAVAGVLLHSVYRLREVIEDLETAIRSVADAVDDLERPQ